MVSLLNNEQVVELPYCYVSLISHSFDNILLTYNSCHVSNIKQCTLMPSIVLLGKYRYQYLLSHCDKNIPIILEKKKFRSFLLLAQLQGFTWLYSAFVLILNRIAFVVLCEYRYFWTCIRPKKVHTKCKFCSNREKNL